MPLSNFSAYSRSSSLSRQSSTTTSACLIASIAAAVGPIAPQITPSEANESMMAFVSKLWAPDRGAAASSATDLDCRRVGATTSPTVAMPCAAKNASSSTTMAVWRNRFASPRQMFGKGVRSHLGASFVSIDRLQRERGAVVAVYQGEFVSYAAKGLATDVQPEAAPAWLPGEAELEDGVAIPHVDPGA